MKSMNLVECLLCLFTVCPVLTSQSATVSGDIRGTITDPSGALLPKVSPHSGGPADWPKPHGNQRC
jgi:hypothetical protein